MYLFLRRISFFWSLKILPAHTLHLILVPCFIFCLTCQMVAQDFEVAPVLVSFNANPGEIQTKTVTVRNHNNMRQKFILSLSDYTIRQDGTKETMQAGSTSRSLMQWLTINPAFVELNPNESAEVQLIMTVPRSGFNTRWGMIHVELAREQSAAEVDKELATGVRLVPRIVVLVKQSPRSNQNYRGKITDLAEVTSPGEGVRSFEATLVNEGDKILEAKVYLALANLSSMEEIQMQPKSVTIYPDNRLKVKLSLDHPLEPGQYALAFLMDYGHRSAIEGAQMMLEEK